MDKQRAVKAWLRRGLEHFYLAFILGEEKRWRHYQPFFDYMGLEVFCKAYHLCERSSEYETLNDEEARQKINEIAKGYSHGLKSMLEEINRLLGDNKINHLLSNIYDSISGSQAVEILESAYLVARYPMPELPIEEALPHLFSGPIKFAYAVGREILYALKTKFDISISNEINDFILKEETGQRFCHLFFNDNIQKYIS